MFLQQYLQKVLLLVVHLCPLKDVGKLLKCEVMIEQILLRTGTVCGISLSATGTKSVESSLVWRTVSCSRW